MVESEKAIKRYLVDEPHYKSEGLNLIMAPFVSSEKEWTRRPMRLLQWAGRSDEEQEEDIYNSVL